MVRHLLAIGLLLVLGARTQDAQSGRGASRVDRVDEWLHALARHTPGEVDDHLQAFATWSATDWQHFLQDSQLFALLLQQPDRLNLGLRVQTSRRRVQPDLFDTDILELRRVACAFWRPESSGACASGAARLDNDLARLASRAEAARERGDAHYVLRLGALLHTDLITWGGTQDATQTRQSIEVNDGQKGGTSDDSLHWTVVYGLLDAIVDRPLPKDGQHAPWIRDWYVASAMLMQQSGRYDQLHLERALQTFPDDPELRFLSACQHEIDASPVIQHAMASLAATLPRGATAAIENPRNELQAAASDLRAALARRPDWGEAHLRLGRVLAQLGNHREAAVHLQTAITRTAEDPALQYLAALFLGASHEQAGRLDAARPLYERAAGLFPSAPSAQLAMSQLARRQGDGDAALTALEPLLTGGAGDDSVTDPWWHYLTLQAREADARFQRLRTLTPESAAR